MNDDDDCIEMCYICLEKLDDACIYYSGQKLKCGCLNRYHTICLNTWLLIQNKCPICKEKINETENKNDDDNNDHNHGVHEEDDNFELEVDDSCMFYNPIVCFISMYTLCSHFINYFF